jgi:hypothetical protein
MRTGKSFAADKAVRFPAGKAVEIGAEKLEVNIGSEIKRTPSTCDDSVWKEPRAMPK